MSDELGPLEPGATDFVKKWPAALHIETAAYSHAISAKRQADALERIADALTPPKLTGGEDFQL